MKTTKGILALVATGLSFGAVAAPSVEVVNIQQQYPWTNTVDITYTVAGVKTHQVDKILLTNETYFVAFEAKDKDGKAIADVSGNTVFTNALVNGPATEVAQWQPALNIQKTGCTMTPSVFRGEENAYLIVNLETNALGKYDWWFEPMSTQAASNKRYNTDEYKTTKMVFRRIPAGTYTIGNNTYNLQSLTSNHGRNSAHEVEVPAGTSYFIAVFPVTMAQYELVMDAAVKTRDIHPQTAVSWATIRGGVLPGTALEGDASHDSSVLIRLAGRTGLPIDLPTEEMWEIAARARSTTVFYWGDAIDNAYCWNSGNNGEKVQETGRKLPNAWGLFDMIGNDWEACRDVYLVNNLAEKETDIYTPNLEGTANYRRYRGGRADRTGYWICASHRDFAITSDVRYFTGLRCAIYPASRYYPDDGQE